MITWLVVGHPRSFTSMFMEGLEAGGMTIAKNAARDRINREDGAHRANKNGLFEVEYSETKAVDWPAQHVGKALKVPAQWVRHLAVGEYRVAFLHRDYEEIAQSFCAWFGHTTAARVETETKAALALLENRKDVIDITHFEARQVVFEPLPQFARLARKGWPVDAVLASKIPDPTLYRQRIEKLKVGVYATA